MKVTFKGKHRETKNIWTFYFEPSKKIRYVAGQHIELHAPHSNHDQRGKNRWFTLSSSPTEELLSITTKIRPKNGSTFKRNLFNSKVGAIFDMISPMGDFVLPKDPQIPLVFVAAGMGITPFRSILKCLTDQDETRKITLIYKESSASEFAFEATIKASPAKLIKIMGQRIIPQQVLEAGRQYESPVYFLAGTEKMIENLQKDLLGLGVKQENIRADFFHNYD